MIVQELFGAESASQVYAQITEWMATLPDEKLRKVKWLLYDDMCHLGEEFNNGNFYLGLMLKVLSPRGKKMCKTLLENSLPHVI